VTSRRGAIAGGLALALVGPSAFAQTAGGPFGMIGRITARPGQRAALARLLIGGTAAMPGCLAYLVAEDVANPDLLWVTEAWDSEASHKASLALPAVRDAIRQGMPMIAGSDTAATTRPLNAKASA